MCCESCQTDALGFHSVQMLVGEEAVPSLSIVPNELEGVILEDGFEWENVSAALEESRIIQRNITMGWEPSMGENSHVGHYLSFRAIASQCRLIPNPRRLPGHTFLCAFRATPPSCGCTARITTNRTMNTSFRNGANGINTSSARLIVPRDVQVERLYRWIGLRLLSL